MSRDFDGTNDQISFGSNANIDGFTAITVAFWMSWDGASATAALFSKSNLSTVGWGVLTDLSQGIFFARFFSGGLGQWRGDDVALNNVGPHHVVVTHDGGLGAPVITVDGADSSIATDSSPSGSLSSDSAQSLIAGELTGATDYDGRLQNFVYDNAVWDAAMKNRHRWYGVPGGAYELVHPMITDSLTNKGTATGNGTATGTTMASLPRTERCYAAAMGCGR